MANTAQITTRAATGTVVSSVRDDTGEVSSSLSAGSASQASVVEGTTYQTSVTGGVGPQGPAGNDGVFSEIASQAEAEAGSNNTKGMSPLRVSQAITALQAVDSVNSATGAVVLDQDDVGDGTTYKQYSQTEKTKLAGIEAGADVTDAANVASAGALMSSGLGSVTQAYDADLAAIAALSPSNDDVIQRKTGAWTNRTMAQVKTDLALTKSDVGLGNVDNTSDANKPISSATQTALDAKVTGPATATDNGIPRYDGTTGELIQGTGYTIDDDDTLLTDGLINSTTVVAAPLVAANTIEEYVLDNGVDIEAVHLEDGLVDGRDVATDGTKLDGIEALADVTDAANVDAAGATMNTDSSLAGNGYFLDEDNMASDSATKVPSQQSVKAYADTKQPLDSDLTAIAALTTTAGGRSALTIADPNADRVLAWDDSAGAVSPIALADITALGDPAADDYLLTYTAEGALTKVNWDDLPGAGGGISNVVEDTTPQLGGNLDLNTFSVGDADAADLTKLSELTATSTELNYVDGVTSAIQTQLDGKQPLDSDLTAIAGLTATTDNFIQSKSSAWASRTPAQVVVDLLPYIYPVGCIYFSTNSTNPATSLGFGTWTAFGAGRVPVGFDSGQTEFDTDEETGGAKTHTLTGAQSGTSAHGHGITDPGHSHALEELAIQDTGSGVIVAFEGNSTNFATGSNTTGITVNNSTEANASQAHNNLQPYIVVRMWKRTA